MKDLSFFKKLITHDDFDGIVCAVLLTTLNPNLEIEFQVPEVMRKGDVKTDKKTIISDLPYIEGCGLWFDHHASNKGEGFHEIAPSAARVIYNNLHLKYPELFRYEDLVEWCDRIDTADYSKKDILKPKGYILLGFTLAVDEDKDYKLHLIKLLRKFTLDQILEDKFVKEKVKKLENNLKNYVSLVKKHIKVYDNLFYILDLRGVDVDPGVKFIAHTLFETQKIGVFLKDQDDNIKISLSYNYLYRENFSPIDLSKLAKYFGGGGHPRASGITISKDKIDDALKDIIKVLDKVDWQPKYKKS